MPLQALVFDIYNTLFRNDTDSWLGTFRDICHIQRLPVSPETLWERWRTFEGRFRQTRTNLEHPEKSPPFRTYQEAWREAFENAFESLAIEGDPDHAAQMSVDGLATREPYQDTLPFLEHVAHGWRRAVFTNADNGSIIPLLHRHRLSFDAVLTSEMVGAYKPEARCFLRILEEIGIPPQEAIYVGDSLFDDIHGAKRAGMQAVWINRAGDAPDPNLLPPDYQVKGLEELAKVLDSLKGVTPP